MNWSELPFYKKINIYGRQLTNFHARYVDKIEAKKIIQEIAPELKVAKLIRILENPDDITDEDIKKDRIIKSAHGSAWNIYLPNDITFIKNKLNGWNNKYYSSHIEKQYSFIQPRFFIEEVIKDKLVSDNLMTYMVRCIKGEPVSLGVKYKNYINNYTLNWTDLIKQKIQFKINKPEELEFILEISRKLSKPFEFVRIDYFIGTDGVYFSEYTFTPNGGRPVFPNDLEYSLGKLWT